MSTAFTKPGKPTAHKPTPSETLYTFTELRALPHIPNSPTSLKFLRRLRSDPGIRHVMQKYKWTVPLLLEMEPMGNTWRDGKTLGLNRNGGEVIELRLRTDWYDGWRDYHAVRKTLCHELAHNVFSEHDREFWELTNKLEKEVAAADWTTGGRALTNEVFYNPPEEEQEQADSGRWEGGTFRLGEGRTAETAPVGGELGSTSRRDIMARAAEERMKRLATAGGSSSAAVGK